MELTPFEKAVAAFFFDLLPVKGSLSINVYELAENRGYTVFHGMLGDANDPIQVVFSVPQNMDDCYFIISDGDPEEIGQQIAAVQDYNENVNHLCLHHTVPTENEYVNESGWSAYLISRAEVTWRDFPDTKDICGRNVRFHLVMPITDKDREIKTNQGVDSLMEQYQNQKRELFTFKRNV